MDVTVIAFLANAVGSDYTVCRVQCYFVPGRQRSIVMGVSVCLAVRAHISETTRPILTEFSLRIAGDRGSRQLWQRCDTVRTSGVDDAMFAHNWSGKGDRKAYLLCHVHRAGYKRSFEWALRLTILLQLNPAVKCRSWFFLGGGTLPSFKGKNKNILHWHRIST